MIYLSDFIQSPRASVWISSEIKKGGMDQCWPQQLGYYLQYGQNFNVSLISASIERVRGQKYEIKKKNQYQWNNTNRCARLPLTQIVYHAVFTMLWYFMEDVLVLYRKYWMKYFLQNKPYCIQPKMTVVLFIYIMSFQVLRHILDRCMFIWVNISISTMSYWTYSTVNKWPWWDLISWVPAIITVGC